MSLLDRLRAWLTSPARPVPDGGPRETWPCPSCGADVEVETTPTGWRHRGHYLPPSPYELHRRCGCSMDRGT